MKKKCLKDYVKDINYSDLNPDVNHGSDMEFNLTPMYDEFTNSWPGTLPHEEFIKLRKKHKAADFPVGLVFQFNHESGPMYYKVIAEKKKKDALIVLPTFIKPFVL